MADSRSSLDLERAHLEGFVESFIERRRRERWRGLVDDSRAVMLLRDFERHLERARCSETRPVDLERLLAATVHAQTGLYVDIDGDRAWLTLDEALGRWRACACDALFSIEPGSLAVVLHHEGWCYLCRR